MPIPSAILSPALFLAGAALPIYSVEELIENMTKAAVLTGVSSFMLAVLFAGMDFENRALMFMSTGLMVPFPWRGSKYRRNISGRHVRPLLGPRLFDPVV